MGLKHLREIRELLRAADEPLTCRDVRDQLGGMNHYTALEALDYLVNVERSVTSIAKIADDIRYAWKTGEAAAGNTQNPKYAPAKAPETPGGKAR